MVDLRNASVPDENKAAHSHGSLTPLALKLCASQSKSEWERTPGQHTLQLDGDFNMSIGFDGAWFKIWSEDPPPPAMAYLPVGSLYELKVREPSLLVE